MIQKRSMSALLGEAAALDKTKRDAVIPLSDVFFLPDGRVAVPTVGHQPVNFDVLADRRHDVPEVTADEMVAALFPQALPSESPRASVPVVPVGDGRNYPAMRMTDNALRQLVGKLTPKDVREGAVRYLGNPSLPGYLRADHLSYWRDNYNGRTPSWLVRSYVPYPGGEPVIRAVLRSNYPVLNNSQILKVLAQYMDILNPTEINGWLQPDSVYLKFQFNRGEAGIYRRLLVIRSDEIGNGALFIAGGLKRTSCDNSIVLHQSVSIRHSRTYGQESGLQAAQQMADELSQAIPVMFQSTIAGLEALNQVGRRVIPDPADAIDAICRANNIPLTDDMQNALVAGSELIPTSYKDEQGQQLFLDRSTNAHVPATVEHLVRAFSAAAKIAKSEETEFALETTAGQLLGAGQFDAMIRQGRASRDRLVNGGEENLDRLQTALRTASHNPRAFDSLFSS